MTQAPKTPPGAGHDAIELTRRLYDEVWNTGNYEVAGELFHPDFAYAAAPNLRGPEAKLQAIRRHRTSSPDLHIQVDDIVVQGDQVAARWTITGTDTGGLLGAAPTHRAFTAWGVDFLGFRDGQIVSDWVGIDWLGTLVQLGKIADPWPH